MAYPLDGDPIAQQVLDALMNRLASIAQPAYHHTVAQVLLLEVGAIAKGRATPLIEVLPGEESKRDDLNGCVHTVQRFLIGATLRVRGNADGWRRELRWLLADIEQAIHSDPQFGGLAWDSHVYDPVILARESTELAQGQIEVEIEYRHRYDNVSVTTA